jgi:hypothetical protein
MISAAQPTKKTAKPMATRVSRLVQQSGGLGLFMNGESCAARQQSSLANGHSANGHAYQRYCKFALPT